MRPTKGELDPDGQVLEAAIPVDLEWSREPGEVSCRARALAVLGVDKGDRRRGRTRPGPVIAGVGPQPPDLGPAPSGIEDRQRGVVRESP